VSPYRAACTVRDGQCRPPTIPGRRRQ
jgi:hypothetical protein